MNLSRRDLTSVMLSQLTCSCLEAASIESSQEVSWIRLSW